MIKHMVFVITCLYSLFAWGEGFVAGTLIKTVFGYAPIETLAKGDELVCKDEFGCQVPGTVVATQRFIAPSYLCIICDDQEICVSEDQRFLDYQNEWVYARDLPLDSNDKRLVAKPVVLYALTVEPHHTFYVTESDICVHNVFHAVLMYPAVVNSVVPIVRGCIAAGCCIKVFCSWIKSLMGCGTAALKGPELRSLPACLPEHEMQRRSMGCLQEPEWPGYGCGNDFQDQGYFYSPSCGYLGDASEYGSIPSPPQKDDDSALKCAKNRNEKKPKGFDPKKNAKEQQAQQQERKRVRNSIIKADNMRDFLENTEFGREIAPYLEKTPFVEGGCPVYRVIKDIPKYGLQEGWILYLDLEHKDHLEVFDDKPRPRSVRNLDGSINEKKKEAAKNRTVKSLK